jgi:hypothetical protein
LANHLLIGRAKRPRTQQQYVSEATTMIRPAKIQEAEILTKISFDSKGYWGYPKEFYDVWAKELTINSDYITNNDVFVFEK